MVGCLGNLERFDKALAPLLGTQSRTALLCAKREKIYADPYMLRLSNSKYKLAKRSGKSKWGRFGFSVNVGGFFLVGKMSGLMFGGLLLVGFMFCV